MQSEGEGSLEDRSFTLVYGQNLVDVSYLHLCAASSKVAEVSMCEILNYVELLLSQKWTVLSVD